MAMRPGYLALLDAASELDWPRNKFSKEDAIALERKIVEQGWVIAAYWQVTSPQRGDGDGSVKA